MKFRALSFDYHMEATQRLLEKGPKEPTLWILPSPAAGAPTADEDDNNDGDSVGSDRSVDLPTTFTTSPPLNPRSKGEARTPSSTGSSRDDDAGDTTLSSVVNDAEAKAGASIDADRSTMEVASQSLGFAQEESPLLPAAMKTPAAVKRPPTSAMVTHTKTGRDGADEDDDHRFDSVHEQSPSSLPETTMEMKTPAPAKYSSRSTPEAVAVVTNKKDREGRQAANEHCESSSTEDEHGSPITDETMELFPASVTEKEAKGSELDGEMEREMEATADDDIEMELELLVEESCQVEKVRSP